jgi:HlyD family secretion protein
MISRPSRAARFVVLVWLVAGGAARRNGLDASGTVEATEADLGFSAAGRIEAVLVQEGDTVRAGAELARLDRAETTARREQAATQAKAAQAGLLELERGSRPEEIRQGRANAQVAADKLVDAERDADRARMLLDQKVISQQEYDKTITTLQVAKSQSEAAKEMQRMVEAGPRRERIDAARAEVASAEAAVRTFDATLANMVIHATVPGIITVRHHVAGETVASGAPVVTLLNREDRWVKIYVPETRVGAVRIGQGAAIRNDTFRTKRYPGTVTYISSEAEFTPKTVQTRDERVKLVYAVKVRISGDPGYELKPGMPVDVELQEVP